jgi:hypothetical protein
MSTSSIKDEKATSSIVEQPKKTWRDRTAFLKDPKFYKVLVLGQCK